MAPKQLEILTAGFLEADATLKSMLAGNTASVYEDELNRTAPELIKKGIVPFCFTEFFTGDNKYDQINSGKPRIETTDRKLSILFGHTVRATALDMMEAGKQALTGQKVGAGCNLYYLPIVERKHTRIRSFVERPELLLYIYELIVTVKEKTKCS